MSEFPLFDIPQQQDPEAMPQSVKEFVVRPITRAIAQPFIIHWHYSHTVNGLTQDYCFGLYYGDTLIGAALFGRPATKGVLEAHSGGKNLIELRRLCCIDKTPRNTESYFIGKMLKWLRDNSDIDIVLSYSDLTYGHEGTIYKASNFEFVGQTKTSEQILYNGKLYHKRVADEYDPPRQITIELREALKNGEAQRVKTQPKNIYIYRIERKSY